jgi:thiamine biosynthesis lipoprotein
MKPPSSASLTRRRFLRISAASAGCVVTASLALADQPPASAWRGTAFGNLASIELRHGDPARTRRTMALATAEIARLESVMSLYRPDSALSELNRRGHLNAAPADLVQILSRAQAFGALSGGAFDTTVQPLWRIYSDHFSRPGADPAGPHTDLVRRAAERIDYRAVEIEPAAIRLARPGMAVTLNGIAQGYITDRIVELLKNEGFEHVLADLGEIRALGQAAPGVSWRAAIKSPFEASGRAAVIDLGSQALATSGSYGFRFDAAGRFHHLFDPRTGACPRRYASVSVLAPDATTADALATACNLLDPEAIAATLEAAGAVRALVIAPDGRRRWIDA